MVFSSHLFVFYFLPAVLALYYLVPRRGKHPLLTAASYVFSGWANPSFVLPFNKGEERGGVRFS